MDASSIGIDLQTRANLCRCCLAPGCSKDLSTEYFCSGQREVYADMLKETFDIQFSYPDGAGLGPGTRRICEVCILQLRDAAAFKRRALDSEARLLDFFAAFTSPVKEEPEITSAVNANIDAQAKSEDSWDGELIIDESIKTEEYDSFDGDNYADKSDELKLMMIDKNENVSEKILEGGEDERPAEERSTQCKSEASDFHKEASGDVKNTIDWPQPAGSRFKTVTKLRHNTLKLLANSTMCVFQWSFGKFRCFCCLEPFSDMTALREHTSTHTLKTIEKKMMLQHYRLVKVDITLLYCKICYTNLADLPELRHHLIFSHNVNLAHEHLLVPFKLNFELKCQLCGEQFSLFRTLNTHMNKHYQTHVCNICGAGFANSTFLNQHVSRVHKAPKCAKCNQEFTNNAEKKQHLMEKHGTENQEHKCNLCSMTFLTMNDRISHISSVHLNDKRVECEACHLKFYSKSDLVLHQVVHMKDKKYTCNVCYSFFVSEASLKRHLTNIHDD